jgi:uncharacterized protein YjbI with pentapeptide repeats
MKVLKPRGPQLARRPMVDAPGLHRALTRRGFPVLSPPSLYSAVRSLYFLASVIAVVAIVRVIVDFSVATLGFLAGIAGVFIAVAAGLQQIEQARKQAEDDSLRRFDARFDAVAGNIASPDAGKRAGSGAALMSFLREENSAFHEQTYYFLLAHLKSAAPGAPHDHAALRAFEQAARLVLPVLANGADPGAHVHGERSLAVDLSGAQLSRVSLDGLELAEANLTQTSLARSDLSGTCLWRASGSYANLASASLRRANLEEAQFSPLIAPDADFTGANLTAARFGVAPNPDFTGANPTAARFGGRHSQSRSQTATGRSVLRHAQFVRARLQGACLNRADLQDARFDGANLKGASFCGALLSHATKQSILRSVSESWRKARWDNDVWHELNELAATARQHSPARRISPARKRTAVPAPNYRRHPFPGHPEYTRRLRISPARSEPHSSKKAWPSGGCQAGGHATAQPLVTMTYGHPFIPLTGK